MTFNCEYCKNTFSTKSILLSHQKSAVYCLEKQGKKLSKKFKCDSCKKTFTQNNDLKRHVVSCPKRISEEKEQHKRECNELKMLFEDEKNKIIEKYENRIKELQDQLIEVIKSRPTTIVQNNNQRINTIINNLQPITDDHLTEQAQYLTLDHIREGAEGYAKYALEYPFKDRIVCVDYARKKIKYKDQDDNIVEDPEMVRLSHKFFKAIEKKNTELSVEQINILGEQLMTLNNNPNNDMDEEETDEFELQSNKLVKDICHYRTTKLDIIDASKGNKSEIYNDFIKNICAKVKL